MGDKEMRSMQKVLGRVRRNTPKRTKDFFQTMMVWLLTLFWISSPRRNIYRHSLGTRMGQGSHTAKDATSSRPIDRFSN